jgi:Golgi phosphoprotein 3 (GPP34)
MTLYLADDLYLVTHDPQFGKALLPGGATGITMAAALLTELVVLNAAMVQDGWVAPGPAAAPPDRLAQALHDQLVNQHAEGTPITEWLADHRRQAVELVADRLVRGQYAHREVSRRLGRTVSAVVPDSAADAFMRSQRLGSYLRNRLEVTEYDVYLAGLVLAVEGGAALLELRQPDRDHINEMIGLLRPVLQQLLAVTHQAIEAHLRNPRAGA